MSKTDKKANNEQPKEEPKAVKVPTNASILLNIFKRGVKDKEEAQKLLIEAQLKAQGKKDISELVNSKGKPVKAENVAAQVTGFLRNLKYKESHEESFYKKGYDEDTWFVVEDEKGIRLKQKKPISAEN